MHLDLYTGEETFRQLLYNFQTVANFRNVFIPLCNFIFFLTSSASSMMMFIGVCVIAIGLERELMLTMLGPQQSTGTFLLHPSNFLATDASPLQWQWPNNQRLSTWI